MDGRLVGYARVSTEEQDLNLQIDALVQVGVFRSNIYKEKLTGKTSNRPQLERCLGDLEPGDTLVVWRLDRLGRSVRHLVDTINLLKSKNIGFRSICDGIFDTSSASGELIFNVFSSLAQFESRLIQERTRAGMAAARSRGVMGGRKKLTAENEKVQLVKKMHSNPEIKISEICKALKISRDTVYRYLRLNNKS